MTTLELRPHAGGGQAVQVLREVADDTDNPPGVGGRPTAERLLDGYLRWTEDAVAKLGNVFERATIDDLVYTQHYWALRAMPGDAVRLLAQVQNELRNRKRVLTELAEELHQEVQRWHGLATAMIVPDTNMFLQMDKAFEDIDWKSLAERMQQVRIIVPIIVIHELDRLKRQGNSTTAQNARRSLRWLAANLPSKPDDRVLLFGGYPEVRLECYVHDGPSRPDDADELIIRVCQRVAQLSGTSAGLVTYDLSMRIRANAAGVQVQQLQDL